jgi:hypothetical protein
VIRNGIAPIVASFIGSSLIAILLTPAFGDDGSPQGGCKYGYSLLHPAPAAPTPAKAELQVWTENSGWVGTSDQRPLRLHDDVQIEFSGDPAWLDCVAAQPAPILFIDHIPLQVAHVIGKFPGVGKTLVRFRLEPAGADADAWEELYARFWGEGSRKIEVQVGLGLSARAESVLVTPTPKLELGLASRGTLRTVIDFAFGLPLAAFLFYLALRKLPRLSSHAVARRVADRLIGGTQLFRDRRVAPQTAVAGGARAGMPPVADAGGLNPSTPPAADASSTNPGSTIPAEVSTDTTQGGTSPGKPTPLQVPTLSLSRTLLIAWVVTISLSIVVLFLRKGVLPSMTEGGMSLLLLASGMTAGSGAAVDLIWKTVASPSGGIWKDLVNDDDGMAIHRVQALLVNLLILGIYWFELYLNGTVAYVDKSWAGLMGISNATYLYGKSCESRPK